MCISQSSSSSDIMSIASQVQQQTRAFLQRFAAALEDDDDEDDFEEIEEEFIRERQISSSPSHQCATKQDIYVDETIDIGFDSDDNTETLTVSCNLETNKLPTSHSSLSLSSITVLTNISQIEDNRLIDDEALLETWECGAASELQQIEIESNVVSPIGSDGSREIEISEWRQMSHLLQQDLKGSNLQVSSCEMNRSKGNLEQSRQEHVTAMSCSWKSARDLQAWDRKMGLRRCHSKTMMDTCISRKRLFEAVGVNVPDEEKQIKRERRERLRAIKQKKQISPTKSNSVRTEEASVVSSSSGESARSSKRSDDRASFTSYCAISA